MVGRRRSAGLGAWLVACVLFAAAPPVALVGAADVEGAAPWRLPGDEPESRWRDALGDPLVPLLRRMDRYFQSHESDGVVLDWRWIYNETEAVRLSVVSQLLGYEELYRAHPSARFRDDIVQRADYLIPRLDPIRSGSVFDGMLGYAFLEAFATTGDSAYLAVGTTVVDELKAIPHSQYILNGGLMAAMAFADHWRLTGDELSLADARLVLSSLPSFQNADGSFPHWCSGSEDVHYTDWMATELILIGGMMSDPVIAPTLERMVGFLERRMDSRGVTRYEEPCDDYEGCVRYYDSVRSGCSIDVDTRAYTNELGYSLLAFSHFRSPLYHDVALFLDSIERGGTVADKWDFFLPPSDPYYVWASADTSVVNMSLLLWSLGSVLRERQLAHPGVDLWGSDDAIEPPDRRIGVRPLPPVRVPVEGGPMRASRAGDGGITLSFALAAPADATVDVFDAAGRRVRSLPSARLAAGAHQLRWDGRDADGRACASGVYFARLSAAGQTRSARVFVGR